jgi:hypothetical protein
MIDCKKCALYKKCENKSDALNCEKFRRAVKKKGMECGAPNCKEIVKLIVTKEDAMIQCKTCRWRFKMREPNSKQGTIDYFIEHGGVIKDES